MFVDTLPYLIPYFLSFGISSSVVVIAWRRRQTAGATAFALVATGQALWTLGYILELSTASLQGKIFWDDFQYLGGVISPLALLLFALDYTDLKLAFPRLTWGIVASIPILFLGLVATNPLHHLVQQDAMLVPGEPFDALVYQFEPVIYVMFGWYLLITLISIGILLRRLFAVDNVYRAQVGLLVLGAIIPVIGLGLTTAGVTLTFQRDTTPLTFALNNLLVAWALFRFRLRDLVPIARETVIEQLSDGVLVVNARNQVVDVNRAAQRMLSAARPTVVGATVSDVFARWPDLVSAFEQTPEYRTENTLSLTEGEQHYKVTLTPLLGRGERLIGRTVIIHDFTGRRRVEESLRGRNLLLETVNELARIASESFDFQVIIDAVARLCCDTLDATSAYFCDWDQEARTTTVRSEYFSMLASQKERFSDLGFAYDVSDRLDQITSWIQKPDAILTEELHDTAPPVVAYDQIEEYDIKSLVVLPLLVEETPIGYIEVWDTFRKRVFTEDELDLLRAVARQASLLIENVRLHEALRERADELERIAVELVAANEELVDLGQIKDAFVANVSHELRTPIASLKLNLLLLKQEPENAPVVLERLERETRRLEVLIEDLLRLSRLDQDSTALRKSLLDLNGLTREYVNDRLPIARSRSLELDLEPELQLPPVQADESLVGQALSILLTNAIQYTPEGGSITVRTQARTDADKLWAGVSVRDTGPGIPPEEQEQLFSRFFRGKAGMTSGQPGTGLGLAIVKEIIDRHDGWIEVVSEGVSGKGATFTLWLPVVLSRS